MLFSLTPSLEPSVMYVCTCVYVYIFSNCAFDPPLAIAYCRGKESRLNHSPSCSRPPSMWELPGKYLLVREWITVWSSKWKEYNSASYNSYQILEPWPDYRVEMQWSSKVKGIFFSSSQVLNSLYIDIFSFHILHLYPKWYFSTWHLSVCFFSPKFLWILLRDSIEDDGTGEKKRLIDENTLFSWSLNIEGIRGMPHVSLDRWIQFHFPKMNFFWRTLHILMIASSQNFK